MWSSLALLTALLTQQTIAQSSTVTIGATGCSGLLADGHCCPGSIIGLGSSNAICCAGDSNLNLINAEGDPNVNLQGSLNGNGMSEGNIMPGPSTCTAGTSTAFSSLPSTASSSGSSTNTASGSTTTTTEGSQVCITTNDNGDMSKSCSGTGAQPSSSPSSGSNSGNGNTNSSGASSGGSSGTSASSSPASTPSGNAGVRPVPFAGPAAGSLLLGVAIL